MKIKGILFLLFFFFCQFFLPSMLFAVRVPSQNDIAKVNQLVENRNFSEAIDSYNQWIALGFKGKWIFYNLGLLYEKTGNIGNAMYYLKKAEKVAPDDALIKKRIILLQEKIKDKFMIPIENNRFIDVFLKPWNYWRLKEAGLFFIISFWLFILYFLFFQVFSISKRFTFYKPVLFIQVGLILFLLIQSIRIIEFSNKTEAIILGDVVEIHRGADMLSPKIQTVHAGLPVLFEDKIGDWIKVRLYNGQIGWLKKNQLSAIIQD
jgi:tetratricopeptide (TPR) repeat protein